eukprot:jgi/Mesen1/7704/ME000405S06997
MSEVKKWLDDTVNNNEQLNQFRKDAQSTIGDLLVRTKTGLVHMEESTAIQIKEAKGFAREGTEVVKAYEKALFAYLKVGVYYAAEYPVYTAAGLTALSLVGFKGPRKFMYRNTFGRFVSEDAMVANAERQVKDLRANVDIHKNETQKLQERVALAEEEFKRGSTKLRYAGAELRRLWKRVADTEQQATGLKDYLRDLPARDSVRMRAEVANLGYETKQQKHELGKRITSISRLGISS